MNKYSNYKKKNKRKSKKKIKSSTKIYETIGFNRNRKKYLDKIDHIIYNDLPFT